MKHGKNWQNKFLMGRMLEVQEKDSLMLLRTYIYNRIMKLDKNTSIRYLRQVKNILIKKSVKVL